MLRRTDNGITTYCFESLAPDLVVHAVFTRLGGVSCGPFSSLNVGGSVGDDAEAVAQNHALIYAHLSLSAQQVATARQVHSNRIVAVTATHAGQILPNTDGLVTDVPGLALMLRLADCQPVLLYDPAHHALGLIHAGWRGIAQGIAYRAVETMQSLFGTQPDSLIVGMGPAIGPCCYTVGDDVSAAMGYALPDWRQALTLLPSPLEGEGRSIGGRWRLDLSAANAQQLSAAGVRNIEQAGLCTGCRTDEFYSHRAEQGRTGRFAVVACLRPQSSGKGTMTADTPEKTDAEPTGRSRFSWPPDRHERRSIHPPGLPTFDETLGPNT